MATKIYGVDGQREAIITVPLANGRNSLKLEFTRGNNNRGAYYRPATCVIADKARQEMVESSPLFKNKLIRLVKTIGTDKPVEQTEQKKKPAISAAKAAALAAEKQKREAAAQAAAEAAAQADEQPAPVADNDEKTTVMDDVTSMEEARLALKKHGAKAAVLLSETAMKNYMARNNIVFPNFEF